MAKNQLYIDINILYSVFYGLPNKYLKSNNVKN